MTNSDTYRNIRIAALVAGGLGVLLFTFCLGVSVGVSAVGRLPRAPFPILGLLGPYFGLPRHGAIGAVTGIQASTLIIVDRLNQQHTVKTSDSTVFEDDRRNRITLQDIHIGDRIVVIGSPANGAIDAVFIRLLSWGPTSDLGSRIVRASGLAHR
jgi:hypothetical protein